MLVIDNHSRLKFCPKILCYDLLCISKRRPQTVWYWGEREEGRMGEGRVVPIYVDNLRVGGRRGEGRGERGRRGDICTHIGDGLRDFT